MRLLIFKLPQVCIKPDSVLWYKFVFSIELLLWQAMGQFAPLLATTIDCLPFNRWRHMFEAEVLMEATVDMVILQA